MSENSSSSQSLSGDVAVLAERYISALFALAEQEGAVDAVLADMKKLQTLWDGSPEWRFVAQDPRLNSDTVEKLAHEVARQSGVGKIMANFIAIVAQHRRLSLLPALIEAFGDEVSKRRGEFRADVKTARPLTDDQRQKLTSLLSAATGGKIRLNVHEDPSIIGGLTVKVGSQFVDASVKTKLDLLERTLRSTAA